MVYPLLTGGFGFGGGAGAGGRGKVAAGRGVAAWAVGAEAGLTTPPETGVTSGAIALERGAFRGGAGAGGTLI